MGANAARRQATAAQQSGGRDQEDQVPFEEEWLLRP